MYGQSGGKAAKSLCILALWMQCIFWGIFCWLPVDFRWPVNTRLRIGVLEAQDGAGVGVTWPFPSGLASGPLRALIEHFRLQQPHPCEIGDKIGVVTYLVPH